MTTQELQTNYEAIKAKLEGSDIPVTLSTHGTEIVLEFGSNWPDSIFDQVEELLGYPSAGVAYCACYFAMDKTNIVKINGGAKDYPYVPSSYDDLDEY